MSRNLNLELKEADADPAEVVTKALNEFQTSVDAKLTGASNDNQKLADRLDKLEAKAARPGIASNDNIPGIETKALNKYIRSGVTSLDDVEKKTLNVGTDASGGYVVAPEYSKKIVEKLVQFSPMRAVAGSSAMNINTNIVKIPVLASGISGAWVSETGNRTSTEPTFDQLSIEVFEYAAIVPVSRQLIEDSFIDLPGYLAGKMGEAFGKAEALSFLTGDGNGKPTGLLTTPTDYNSVTAAADGSDILDKVIEAFYALPAAYASQGSWMMTRKMQGVIRAAADNATKGTLWSDSLANGTPAALLGRPVYDAPDMDDLPTATGTKYPIAFGDFASAYQIVDRSGLQIIPDYVTGLSNGIVKFHARYRIGGKPVLSEPVILVKSTKA